MILQNEIPIVVEHDLVVGENIIGGSINSLKNALMQTIDKLSATIDFLQNELEERNLHIRTLLLRDANEGRSIDMELLNKTPILSLMETTPSDIHENDFSAKNISEHVSQFNDTKLLISEQDTAVVKEINDDASIYSGNSSISLDSSIIDDSCDSSNDESNYSINTSFMMIDNYDINEHLIVNSSFNSRYLQSSCRQSLEPLEEIQPINYCNYVDYDNDISQKHSDHINLNNTVNHWNIMTSDDNTNIDFMNIYQSKIDERALWNTRTTLIVGDSMLYGLDESRL